MDILDSLAQTAGSGKLTLELEEVDLPGDLETPVSAYLKLQPVGARFLLESAEGSQSVGRYTFIGIDPLLRIEIRDQSTVISSKSNSISVSHTEQDAPFDGLRLILNRFEIPGRAELPLLGGVVGFTSYEIVRFIEPSLVSCQPKSDWPIALFYFVDKLLVFDHFMRRMKLLRLRYRGKSLTSGDLPVGLEQITSALHQERMPGYAHPVIAGNGYSSNVSQKEFEAIVAKTQKYIVKGDIFQAVVSRCEERQSRVDSFSVYRALRMLNPSPYMYYLDFEDLKLVGSSPEALVKCQNGLATIRPIAGTRRRGKDTDADRRMAEELLRDEKERAEHIMLVDLARNDLGRVCKYGTIAVPTMMELEHYSHVMHLTSTVTGQLRDSGSPFELFRAAYPAGTVSGAPKLRAMEIIAELEGRARGPYAGAVGYFSLSGDFDLCITIRTIVMRNNMLYLQAGAGIVADSIPELEYLETQNKIAVLKQAVARAEDGRL